MISDIKGVRYTEGRLLPYFFPDVFTEGGDPIGEARTNWMKARRAILRSPLDRIGYGGYLKLASNWPGFIDEIQNVVASSARSTKICRAQSPTLPRSRWPSSTAGAACASG